MLSKDNNEKFSFIKKYIKKVNIWYVLVLILSSIYVYFRRYDIYQLTELNAYNLVFIIWLLIILWPLVSEIDILGFKIRKDLENNKQEIKKEIIDMRLQMLQVATLSNNNQVLVTTNFGETPSIDEIEKMKEKPNVNGLMENLKLPENNLLLFKIRFNLEEKINEVCNNKKYWNILNEKSIPRKIQLLRELGAIDFNLEKLIRQVLTISNRGVHGEVISAEYIEFAQMAYPKIIEKLDFIIQDATYLNSCSRCGYSGYWKIENQCPKCGFVTDDY